MSSCEVKSNVKALRHGFRDLLQSHFRSYSDDQKTLDYEDEFLAIGVFDVGTKKIVLLDTYQITNSEIFVC